MERYRGNSEVENGASVYLSPEEVALQALVDVITYESDKRLFEMFNRILDQVREEDGEA